MSGAAVPSGKGSGTLDGPPPAATAEEQLQALQLDFSIMKNQMAGIIAAWDQKEKTFTDEVNKEFQTHKSVMEQMYIENQNKIHIMYTDTQTKMEHMYTDTENKFKDIYAKTQQAVERLDIKVNNMESDRNQHRDGNQRDSGNKDYIPTKNMMPKTFMDKLEDWRGMKTSKITLIPLTQE